tara:strand:- start:4200 stop:5402 length:1203 start_codon:yes stop_codon:yes gene_type:complete
MALTNEEKALAAKYSPLYQNAMAAQQKAQMERQAELSAAQLQGGSMQANKDKYLGTEQRLGIPSVDPRYRTVQGTGFNAPNIDPMRKFMAERNYEMGVSGVPELGKQGLSNDQAMQSSINSGINTIAGKQWDKANIPQKADTTLEQLHIYRQSLQPGDPRIASVDNAILKASTHSKLVDVNMGGSDPLDELISKPTDLLNYQDKDGNPPPGPVTMRELRNNYMLDKKLTEGDSKASYVSDSLSTASSMVESVLSRPGFNPTGIKQVPGQTSKWLASSQYKQYLAAADEWATNLVFLRSGATARQEEKDSAFDNFWPQPDDDKESAAFKDKFRLQQEINAYRRAAQAGRVDGERARTHIAAAEEKLQLLESPQPVDDLDTLSDEELTRRYNAEVLRRGNGN